MGETIVDKFHIETKELLELLDKHQEISLRNTADDCFRKALILAAASYFERKLTECVLDFVTAAIECNLRSALITAFVKNKAISRQYHTWSNWSEKSANSFFGLFGENFRDFMKMKVKNEPLLDESIKAFLELGEARNRLVHQDFGAFTLEKTSDEIYSLYQKALFFIDNVPTSLENYSSPNTLDA